jgi:hypothetical protein
MIKEIGSCKGEEQAGEEQYDESLSQESFFC